MPLVSHLPYSLNLAFDDLFLFIKVTCTQKEMISKSSKRHPQCDIETEQSVQDVLKHVSGSTETMCSIMMILCSGWGGGVIKEIIMTFRPNKIPEIIFHCLHDNVPLQAWSCPEGSRKLRFPDFMTTAQDGGKFVSLTHRPPLPPGNTPGTHFC